MIRIERLGNKTTDLLDRKKASSILTPDQDKEDLSRFVVSVSQCCKKKIGPLGGGEETEGTKNYEGKESWGQGEDRCSNRNRCCNRSVRLIGKKDVITPSASTLLLRFSYKKRTFIFQKSKNGCVHRWQEHEGPAGDQGDRGALRPGGQEQEREDISRGLRKHILRARRAGKLKKLVF